MFEDLIDAKRILREIKLLMHLKDHENIIHILDISTMPAVSNIHCYIYIYHCIIFVHC